MDTKKFLTNLTIDEKIRLLSGVGDWHTYDCDGKVPAIMMTDGPHGLRKVEMEERGDTTVSNPATCFPTASALASSWNPDVIAKCAKTIAKEAKKEKVSIVLGCGVNIKRSPLCGRNFEYFSEDPFLTGKLATSYINAVQKENVGTSLKHFAANSQEKRRMTSNSEIDERTLREIYLSAFEEVVKNAKPTTVMASYNRVNGVHSCKNKHLLKDILRDEWGYEGAVVSDWGAANDIVNCYKNGMTLEMPDPKGYHTEVLKEAYEKGEVTEAEIDRWAEEVLINFSSLNESVEEGYEVDYHVHHQIAREIEDECAVLLKNRGVLPISPDKRIIVIGDLASNMRFQGGGSSHINPTEKPDAVKSLRECGYKVEYARGYKNDTEKTDEALVKEALGLINRHYDSKNTVILFFMGLTETFEGEGYDRDTLEIPHNQVDLLERVSGSADPANIAIISFGGAPMNFSFDENADAVLHMYLGGQAVGDAVADLVSGKVNPSGKLAETMPLVITDTPAWRYFAPPHDDVEYREGIFVGYRYYETFNVDVKYPFGHGLSYTQFEYSDLHVPEVYENGEITISFTVKNVGRRAGAEVCQVYVLPDKEDIIRSRIELKGFDKVYLEPLEEKSVEITLNERSFSVYDVDKKAFSVIAGVYSVAVGASIKNLRLIQNIVVNGNKYFRNERLLFPDYFKKQPHGMEVNDDQYELLLERKPYRYRDIKRGGYTLANSFEDVASKSLFGRHVKRIVGIGLKFMFPGKREDDPAFKMIKTGLFEGTLEGLIALSGGLMTSKLVDMILLNANRHYLKAFARMFKR